MPKKKENGELREEKPPKKKKKDKKKRKKSDCTICGMKPVDGCVNGVVPIKRNHGGSWIMCSNKKLFQSMQPIESMSVEVVDSRPTRDKPLPCDTPGEALKQRSKEE